MTAGDLILRALSIGAEPEAQGELRLRAKLREEGFEERAGIAEFDGGLARHDAETLALLDGVLACGEWLLKKRPDLPADLPARLAALVEREMGSCR